MVSTPHPEKKRIGRETDHGIETVTARETEMSGIEADTAADPSEMEGQSAAEEMNRRARDTDLKMQLLLQGPPGRKRTVAMASQGARSGNPRLQRLLTGILSGAIDSPVVIGIGLCGAGIQTTHLCQPHPTNTMSGPMTEDTWAPRPVCPGAEEDARMVKREFRSTQKRNGSSGRMTRGKRTGIGT